MVVRLLYMSLMEDPEVDILTEGWLHKVMVAFSQPEKGPGWLTVLAGFLPAWFVRIVWQRVNRNKTVSRQAGWLQFLFWLADVVLFLFLPRRRLSFGPWKSQTMVLGTARLLLTLPIALLAVWWGQITGLITLFVAQVMGTLALVWGTVFETHQLQLSHLAVTTDRLPVGAAPIRLLHISDLHVERLTKREAHVLALVKEANPDLILITGDYVKSLLQSRPRNTGSSTSSLKSTDSSLWGVCHDGQSSC